MGSGAHYASPPQFAEKVRRNTSREPIHGPRIDTPSRQSHDVLIDFGTGWNKQIHRYRGVGASGRRGPWLAEARGQQQNHVGMAPMHFGRTFGARGKEKRGTTGSAPGILNRHHANMLSSRCRLALKSPKFITASCRASQRRGIGQNLAAGQVRLPAPVPGRPDPDGEPAHPRCLLREGRRGRGFAHSFLEKYRAVKTATSTTKPTEVKKATSWLPFAFGPLNQCAV